MNSVKFDPCKFESDLLDASKMNDSKEISNIVVFLNSKSYTNHIDISLDLMHLVEDFDPVDKQQTIENIFNLLSPEHKELFSPVNVITHHYISYKKKRPWLSGCFS